MRRGQRSHCSLGEAHSHTLLPTEMSHQQCITVNAKFFETKRKKEPVHK